MDSSLTPPTMELHTDPPARTKRILDGLRTQNEPAVFDGRSGFWCQSDAVFIPGAASPQDAIRRYRAAVSAARVAVCHNHFCGSILAAKRRPLA